ncbi:MAG: right-handed parallel beta-helix repeat-containing protein [Candidatus Bathyarchaeota archaeon]|nr:MAG: right-handed parallel beta-helix repeat-containing protein [Candidatus Bathyarchaeota archaeon]
MKSKVVLILLCLSIQYLAWNSLPISSFDTQNNRVIYIPNNYTTIQEGINEAVPGDTIFVQSGVYNEHVVVNKSISLIGEQAGTTVVDGGGSGSIISVTASNTQIINLTTRNGTYGILVENVSNVSICRNKALNNIDGIVLYNSENCTVAENNSTANRDRGIFINSCRSSIVYKNIATNNPNQYGISANASRNVALVQNTAVENGFFGMGLQSSINCILWRNNVSRNNIFGIWFDSSNNSIVYHNILVDNTVAPNTTINAAAANSDIFWDSGYPSGGNYWSDYNFTNADIYHGIYQNETGSDGIGDTPYVIELPYHQDKYPLIAPRANGSALFLAVRTKTIKPGADALIYGALWPKLHGVNITIHCRPQGEEIWQTLETVPTHPDGTYSYIWVKPMEGTYELKTDWSGNSSILATESLIETLIVQKLFSRISMKVEPIVMHVGSTVTISGYIEPMRPFVNVTIWHRSTNEPWTILRAIQSYENSSYSFEWLTTKAGNFRIKAGWLGDEITKSANSSETSIIVIMRNPSNLSINVDHTTVSIGSNIVINGTLNPVRINVNVTIQYRPLNGTWTILDTVVTTIDGGYSYTWKTTDVGEYEIKTSWPGDLETLPTESGIITITIEGEWPSIYILLAVFITAILIIITSVMYLRKKQIH